jgi:hypothetical protein
VLIPPQGQFLTLGGSKMDYREMINRYFEDMYYMNRVYTTKAEKGDAKVVTENDKEES